MRIARLVAGLAGVLGLVITGFVTSSASATTSNATPQDIEYGYVCEQSKDDGENGAKTCWWPDGDIYTVCDIDHDDDKHAWGRIKWQDRQGRWHKEPVRKDFGARDWKGNPCHRNNTDIPEHRLVKVVSCIQNGHHRPKGCDSQKAWSSN